MGWLVEDDRGTQGGAKADDKPRQVPMVGSLESMPLPVLLQSLEMNRSSGELQIAIDGRIYGRLWLDHGELIDAQSGGAKGAEAVYRSLVVEGGQFRVDFGANMRARTIRSSTQSLLLEGMRRLDHMRRLSDTLPRFDSSCQSNLARPPANGRAKAIWESATDPIRIRDLVNAQADALEALELVSELFEQGALTEVAFEPNMTTFDDLCPTEPLQYVREEDEGSRDRRRGPRVILAAAAGVALLASGAAALTLSSRSAPATENSAPASAAPDAPSVASPRCPEGTVYVAGGRFKMGTDSIRPELADALPPHDVELHSYCVEQREVTVRDYRACSDRGQCLRAWRDAAWPQEATPDTEWERSKQEASQLCNEGISGNEERPVNCVTQAQAAELCEWRGRRLLTEAEWEYVARGNGPTELAAITDGLAEWTSDRAHPYGTQPRSNPHGPSAGATFIVRGAPLDRGGSVDVAFRDFVTGDARLPSVGFRCATDPT